MVQALIGEILIEREKINSERLWLGLEEQAKTGKRLGDALLSLGYISEDDILSALSLQSGLPALDKEARCVVPGLGLSPEFLSHHRAVPVEKKDGVLKVAVSSPGDSFPLEAIRLHTGLEVEPVLWSEREILDLIDAQNSGSGEITVEKIVEGIGGNDAVDAAYETEDAAHLADMADKAPVVNLVNLIISRAHEKRASDVHIEPFEDMLHVRYRIDGILYLIESLPKGLHPAIASRVKIISKLNIAERRLPQDGRFKFKSPGKPVDIRVSTIPTLYGESIVMRLLDPSGIMSLEDVGFSEANRRSFAGLIKQPHGIVLVTGPTGSGKSTTLYAALSRIDTVEKKVITIEDPVEYNLGGVNQIQVKPKIGFTFANGLRSIVRQDPDVIMVGEIRDAETANIAVHSALTGHLILSTLHTNDAPGAITRLMDMGVESYLISSSLLGVLAQRLVRVICQGCKTPYTPDPDEIEGIGAEDGRPVCGHTPPFDHTEDIRAFRGAGCSRCAGTGYRGRTGIFEFMVVTDALKQMIVEKKGANVLKGKAIEEGMVTLREDGWEKVRQGITTIDEVKRLTLGR